MQKTETDVQRTDGKASDILERLADLLFRASYFNTADVRYHKYCYTSFATIDLPLSVKIETLADPAQPTLTWLDTLVKVAQSVV